MLCSACLLLSVSTLPIGIAPIASTTIQLTPFQSVTSSELQQVAVPKPPPTETVAIIVQNSLYPAITASVNQYHQDLNDSGYNTILYTQVINTHQEIKGNLSLWYSQYSNFKGAVIIGRLPFAQYYHPASANFAAETFICDLYLMDLDGNWYDLNTDTVYDKHNATFPGDIYPEIFVARIDPLCLTWDIAANFINTYLPRVHSYRVGGVQRTHRALVYIDDDWTGYWGNRWFGDVGLAYPTRTLVDFPTTWTNGTDWVNNRLIQNYQWTHITVHSSATAHWFGPGGGGGEGIMASNPTIKNAPPSFNFYNLFACHGSQWTTADCLGVTYTFSGSYSLATVGSTKTGGMMDCDYFYGPLGQNDTLGDSLVNWFSNSLNTGSSAGSEYLEWYYGMNIIGDPFLSIHYDCTVLPTTVSSMSHPNPAQWYTNGQPQFNWTIPVDVNGISGYYYIIDQNPSTVPTMATGTWTSINGTKPATSLADGTWYIHVVARDGAGNVGLTAAHYQVNIDSTAPIVSITFPANGATTTNTTIQITWTVNDPHSGYNYAELRINGILNDTILSPILTKTVTGFSVGSYTINVTAYDGVGNSASNQISITIQSPTTTPTTGTTTPIPGFPLEALMIGLVTALFGTLLLRRRRR